MSIRSDRARWLRSRWVGIAASGLLCHGYALGGAGWVLGFVALVPWLLSLRRERSLAAAMLNAWAMAVVFTAAVFGWFGLAVGAYTQAGAALGLGLLLLAAPLFQPQFLAFAAALWWGRRCTGQRAIPVAVGPPGEPEGLGPRTERVPLAKAVAQHAGPSAPGLPLVAVLAATAAWAAAEWALPRLLDDTLGHGLHPSRLLRQAADLGGATGLTVLLLLCNQALAVAWWRRGGGVRAVARPLALALAIPLALAAYGAVALARLQPDPAAPEPRLRMGLVQSNLHDYERLRAEKGAAAVVREVLDTHYAMSWDAVERQRAQAVLWSETVYPTTFGRPKSAAGAELDREILEIVNAAGVPFVFGTYERSSERGEEAEYNAAAFVQPGTGLLGFYRKTRLFPLTERLPAGLDHPGVRRWLPWAGAWRPGDGARVLPLRLADGRGVPVQPLICLDDVDAGLAIAGARLGARALLTLSNDAWFIKSAQGARLHAAVAAFRSIETRLPQFRVTTTGISAAIDRTGTPVATTGLGERSLLVADLPVGEPPPTLMVTWGDWVGPAAAAAWCLWGAAGLARRWAHRQRSGGLSGPGTRSMLQVDAAAGPVPAAALPRQVVLLPPWARGVAVLLRLTAWAGIAWLLLQLSMGDGSLLAQPRWLLRSFLALVLLPQAAAWCFLRAFLAHLHLGQDALVFSRGRQQRRLPLARLAAVQPWRWPLPVHGVGLRLGTGERWALGLVQTDPLTCCAALQHAVFRAGGPALSTPRATLATAHAQAKETAACRGWVAHGLARFGLLPLLLALPAFRLHQHITYGSAWGQALTEGLLAYAASFALWWASWLVGVVLCAAVLRALIEGATLAVLLWHPASAGTIRWWLERGGLAALYLGLPAWLALRLLGG